MRNSDLVNFNGSMSKLIIVSFLFDDELLCYSYVITHAEYQESILLPYEQSAYCLYVDQLMELT